MQEPDTLAAQRREATDAGLGRERPATCQLGGSNRRCGNPAEVKVADGWGDSAWGCLQHAENVVLEVPGVFLADEALSGLADYLKG